MTPRRIATSNTKSLQPTVTPRDRPLVRDKHKAEELQDRNDQVFEQFFHKPDLIAPSRGMGLEQRITPGVHQSSLASANWSIKIRQPMDTRAGAG
jgi:hypothetical protein